MELHIHRGSVERTVGLLLGNIFISTAVVALVVVFGDRVSALNLTQLLLESVSALVVFALFTAAALVQVSIARMMLLFGGLYLFQLGHMLDVLDEFIAFPLDLLSTLAEILSLSGEVMLALVAFHFVTITKEIASTDRLTSLHNKAYHQRRLRQALEKSGSEPSNIAVVAIDLDKFKLVNDRHGHAFGDAVLKHVAGLLHSEFSGRRNVVSRTGGEEFELLLTRSNRERAIKAAEKVRTLIESQPPEGLEKLTASVGVALNEAGESAISLRKRADAAAYMAKQSGRNRVCLAVFEDGNSEAVLTTSTKA